MEQPRQQSGPQPPQGRGERLRAKLGAMFGSGRIGRGWKAFGGTLAFVVVGGMAALLLGQPNVVSVSNRQAPAPRPSPPPRVAPVASDPAAPSPDPDAFDCMIKPSEVVEIRSPITGRIETIHVERSDYVEAGQVLVKLESSVEEAAVRVAEARAQRTVEVESGKVNLALLDRRRARAVELFERDSLSLDVREEVETEASLAELRLEQAREDHRVALLQLEQARAALERRTIRSPVSGYVVERLMAPGEVVDEETVLRIAQVDPLRVEAILPSQWFGRVQRGDRVEIVPEAPLDQARPARVQIVDPLIDGASGTFGARLLLPNPQRELPAGLRCQLRFVDAS